MRHIIIVEGTTPGDVKEVAERLKKEIGCEIDLTPHPLRFFRLPRLGIFFLRVKFLFWDFIVKGEVGEEAVIEESTDVEVPAP